MIVVTWNVSLVEMSSYIVVSNMKFFIKKNDMLYIFYDKKNLNY